MATPPHLSEAKEAYLREGTKGLTVINGGGAIALLAFLQAIWDKPGAGDLRANVLWGICFLIGGVAVSSLIYLARHIAWVKNHTRSPQFWYVTANRIMPIVSILCFIAGMGLTVYGGFSAPSPQTTSPNQESASARMPNIPITPTK